MGLRSFLNRRKSQSQPNSPQASPSGSPLHKAENKSKKFFMPYRRSSAKRIPAAETPKFPPLIRRTRSNPSKSRLASIQYVQDLEDVFKKFDANGDGKISGLELGSIMGSLGYNASEQELQCMVREADSDGDGFIDLQEFIELNTRGIDSAGSLQDLRDAFEIFDLDRNGSISSDELHKVLRNLGENSTIEDCQRMIKGVDSDGDGFVDFEEFKIMMTSAA